MGYCRGGNWGKGWCGCVLGSFYWEICCHPHPVRHFSTLPTDKIKDIVVNVLSVQVHQGRWFDIIVILMIYFFRLLKHPQFAWSFLGFQRERKKFSNESVMYRSVREKSSKLHWLIWTGSFHLERWMRHSYKIMDCHKL